MVSAQPAAGSLPRGGRAVTTDANESNYERLAVLFELGTERSAVALVSTSGLAALPTLAGELARRYSLHPVDLSDEDDEHDPYAELTRLPRGRVLVGLSLLSPTRMRECLGRLNRGRDRIHALGLHVVLVIDEVDLRSVHALAPDFASRIHELLHFELEYPTPAGALVLSPLGPLRQPEVGQAHARESEWVSSLVRLGSRAQIELGHEELLASAVSLAWRFAATEHTWVAWIDVERWDPERANRWLRELGLPRLVVVIDGRERPPLELPSWVSVARFRAIPQHAGASLAAPKSIELGPEPLPVAADLEPRHYRSAHGQFVWLISALADAKSATELANALVELDCGVVRLHEELEAGAASSTAIRQAAAASDAAIVLLSPAAIGTRWIAEELRLIAESKPERSQQPTIVLLDGVSAAEARDHVGREPILLTFGSPRSTAKDILRVLQATRTGVRWVSTHRSADELILELREDAEAPLSLAELRELRWYLLDYPRWPFGYDRNHARSVEAELPVWGRALLDFATNTGVGDHERIVIESDAHALHALPWELSCDADGFLSARGIGVVRRYARVEHRSRRAATRPDVLRVLLVLARPREFPPLDPRATVEPLSEVLSSLGQRAELHVLARPSFAEVAATLANADARGQSFQVVHYDGHGTIDDDGRACLAFEGESESQVPIERLASKLHDRGIELCVLDLHWDGVGGVRPAPAYAVELLVAGVRRVVALDVPLCRRSHALFIHEFYRALAEGELLDRAMNISRHVLREQVPEPVVRDWFVPMLFEADAEPLQLVEPKPPPRFRRRRPAGRLDRVPARAEHGFYGRYEELLALDERLRAERAVVVHGAQGLGKTALAAELARWQLQMQRFHHVLWFEPNDAATVGEVVDELEQVLRHREVLLVIDALDTWPDTGMLERLAEFPGVRVLGTSRIHPRTLGADLRGFVLEGLDDEHGVALLADLISCQPDVDELGHDRLELEELVARVGGHPATLLALAPLVAERGIEEAARRWVQRAVVPDSTMVDQLEPELRTELSAVAAGGDMLQPPLIGHVLGSGEAETMKRCQRWLDHGLAYLREDLIFIQPEIRAGLLMPLDASTRAELERRWLSAYFWVVFATADRQLELDHIRGLEHALIDAVERAIAVGYLDPEQYDDVLGRLQRTVRPIASPAATRRLDELLERIDTWYARVDQVERALERGDSSEALTAAEQLLAEVEASANDPDRHADALFLFGRALHACGRLEDALDALQRSHDAYASRGDHPVGADWMIARVLRSLGRLDEAAELTERMLEDSERAGATSFDIAHLTADLGVVRELQGRFDEASSLLKRALELFEETHQPQLVIRVNRQLGRVYERMGRYEQAERVYLNLLEFARERGETTTQLDALLQLARIYAVSGRLAHAASNFEAAAQLAERSGVLAARLTALTELASVQRRLGRTEAALRSWDTARDLYRAHRERGGSTDLDPRVAVELERLIAAKT